MEIKIKLLLDQIDLAGLKKVAATVETGVVFDAVFDKLETLLSEKEFISFCNSL